MRFYNHAHAFYCGVDLHARTMYLCILDHGGAIVLHNEVPCEPAAFLEAITPYRDGQPTPGPPPYTLRETPLSNQKKEILFGIDALWT